MSTEAEPGLTLAIDAMGGDHAPEVVIDGLAQVNRRYPGVRFLVFGDQARVVPILNKYAGLSGQVEFEHTPDVVTADMKPSVALRKGRSSSMGLAVQAVSSNRAQGVVSAGNTGAYMALAMLAMRMIPGIHRPAMCKQMPTMRGQTLVLDLGANVECSPQNLVQFAVMGEFYAREVLGVLAPTVGLLNVGSEETKGSPSVKEAAILIRESQKQNNPLVENFHGFIEGNDIGAGTVDVVVADGFSGNIALKTAEGTAKMIVSFLKEAFSSNLKAKIGYLLAKSALDDLLGRRLDPRWYNGAIFLGLNGVAIKSHGGTDAVGYAHAVEMAIKTVKIGLNAKIKNAFETRVEVPSSVLGCL
jgi:glycerol-3-phosphate acyltransferase PlsX